MGKYLASQIIAGRMTYAQAIATKWGKKYKDDIDATIVGRGYMIDDSGACVKKPEETADESADGSTDTDETETKAE